MPLAIGGCGAASNRTATAPAPGAAEVREVRLTRQYGLGFLPLMVMESEHLIEKEAKSAGLGEVKVTWSTVGSGAASTDALLSGGADFTSMGLAPTITLWAKTHGGVKGLAALGTAPMTLNSTNPNVHRVEELTEKDRIALPAVKVSLQAVLLQMAAAKAFGEQHFAQLDSLTVSMKHPDAMAALLSGGSDVSGHFTGEPFSSRERADPRIHPILNSFDLLGGPHTDAVLSTTQEFYTRNPRTNAAVLKALRDADTLIRDDRTKAAQIYLSATHEKSTPQSIVSMLKDPQVTYELTPRHILTFSDFMSKTGAIKEKPTSWKELFFPDVHSENGS